MPSNQKSSRSRPSPWLSEQPLGQGLREAYQDVSKEPIPERLKSLIEDLKRRERQQQR